MSGVHTLHDIDLRIGAMYCQIRSLEVLIKVPRNCSEILWQA